jgi:hypothetical protein
MASVKDLVVAPVSSADANALVRRIHYSGKVAPNSQLHLGAFWEDRLEGVMQFGPSLDKKKVQPLVAGTGWNGFLELNRLAFSSKLPRNSESRALAVAFRMIRKHYPHIEWVISFADGTQCGDGAIYRASGFVLTGIKKNTTILEFPDGETISDMSVKLSPAFQQRRFGRLLHGTDAIRAARDAGAKSKLGYQLRYIYFLNPSARERLTVPVIPFSKIDEVGAGMYKGQKVLREKQAMAASSGTATV